LDDPRFLTDEDVIALHSEYVQKYGGQRGIRDANLLGSAVAQPIHAYQYGGKRWIFDLATEYAFSLSKNHAFHNGNKRIAAAATINFLDINGWLVEQDFDAALTDLVKGEINKKQFSAVLYDASRKKPAMTIINLIEYLQEFFEGRT
jgi:death on curing protein